MYMTCMYIYIMYIYIYMYKHIGWEKMMIGLYPILARNFWKRIGVERKKNGKLGMNVQMI